MKEQLVTPREAEVEYRFDQHVRKSLRGDWEGLKISNYQIAGEHAAQRIKDSVGKKPILEVCTGVGATTFVLARYFPKVYAVDIDSNRLKIAEQNLVQLQLLDKVNLINGDILDRTIVNSLKDKAIGAIYTDVHWTKGDDWTKWTTDIRSTVPDTLKLFEILSSISTNFCMKLPSTINLDQLRELDSCEVEEICPDGRLSFYLVYFGDLIGNKFSRFEFPKYSYQ